MTERRKYTNEGSANAAWILKLKTPKIGELLEFLEKNVRGSEQIAVESWSRDWFYLVVHNKTKGNYPDTARVGFTVNVQKDSIMWTTSVDDNPDGGNCFVRDARWKELVREKFGKKGIHWYPDEYDPRKPMPRSGVKRTRQSSDSPKLAEFHGILDAVTDFPELDHNCNIGVVRPGDWKLFFSEVVVPHASVHHGLERGNGYGWVLLMRFDADKRCTGTHWSACAHTLKEGWKFETEVSNHYKQEVRDSMEWFRDRLVAAGVREDLLELPQRALPLDEKERSENTATAVISSLSGADTGPSR